jgi:hypothetical protein
LDQPTNYTLGLRQGSAILEQPHPAVGIGIDGPGGGKAFGASAPAPIRA